MKALRLVPLLLMLVLVPALAEEAAPKKAVCTICREGPEPVAAQVTWKGRTYYFCKAEEKEIFLADPSRWTGEAAPPGGAVPS